MSLHDDIQQATVLDTRIKESAKFRRLKGLSQANKDRKMNEREVPVPKNINILEDSCVDNIIANCETNMSHNKGNHTKNYEISAAIREMNGGQDLSNKHIEQDWKKVFNSRNNTEEDLQSFPHSSDRSSTQSTCSTRSDSPEVPNWTDNYHDTQKHKVFRNAAFMGLVRCNIISVGDLIYRSYGNVSSDKKGKEENGVYNYEYQMEAIPHDEDPDVHVHPLQIGLDEKQYKHIDFSLPRIAKKKRITPQEYYLTTTDERFFKFVKKQ